MRRWPAALSLGLFLLGLLCLGQQPKAYWQSRDQVSVGGSVFSYVPTANPAAINNGFGTSISTFTNQPIDPATSDRQVIVFVASTVNPTTGVTCAGNAMAVVAQSDPTGTQDASIWQLNVTTGTTCTIVVTGGIQGVAIMVGVLKGANATATTTAIKPAGGTGDPQVTTTALTVPTGGIGLVMMGVNGGVGGYTWNVGTQDFGGSTVGAVISLDSGHITATGSQTPSISGPAFATTYMAAATWGP